MSNNGTQNILNHTKQVYETVINRVCQKLLEDQENDGLAVEVIDQFKEAWKKKIEERKVYIVTEPAVQQNNEVQKKEGSSNNQSRQSGGQLQMNANKNELSEDKAQELLNQVNQQSYQNMQKDQFVKQLVHNHPNPDIQGHTIKKIKTEDNSSYQASYSTHAKLEEGSPNFGVSDHDEMEIHNLQHDQQKMIIHNQNPDLQIDNFELVRQYVNNNNNNNSLNKSVKIEEQEVNYMDALEPQHQEDDENMDDQQDQTDQDRLKKENKNEEFLYERTENHTDSHICGYYSVMKKKTAKKFKIQFEKMIASIQGKDYIITSLCGDLEW